MSMGWMLALLGLMLGVLLGWWAIRAAQRLDRLHRRVDAAWCALDSALLERAHIAGAAASGAIGASPLQRRAAAAQGPDAAVPLPEQLAWSAQRSLRADPDQRATRERELSAVLTRAERAHDRCPVPRALVAQLGESRCRVSLAAEAYAAAVRDAGALRERPVVRLLRLAGRAPRPAMLGDLGESGPAAAQLPGIAAGELNWEVRGASRPMS